MRDGVWEWVWQHHSVAKAMLLSVVATGMLVIGCWISGRLFFSNGLDPTQLPTDVSILNTLAQVTGAIFGTLLAVVTFSVGLRAQREDEASSLLPFVAQRYGMFLIAGGAVALTAADGILPILQPWAGHGAIKVLLALNVVLMPATLVLSLWLVCKVIQDAGVSNLENTLPVFRATMRLIALREARLASLIALYQDALSKVNIEYNLIAWHTSSWSRMARHEFPITGRGRVRDVDVLALKDLGKTMSGLGRRVKVQITVRPGDRLGEHAMLVVEEVATSPAEGGGGSEEAIASPGIASGLPNREIQMALRRLFLTRRGS